MRDNLARFEAPGGLLTSTARDRQPVGRAVRLGAAAADRGRTACAATGSTADADRVARKFLALVTKEFEEHGTIVEKYDVRRRESDVSAGHPLRLQHQRDRLRLDQRAPFWSCWRDCARLADEPHGRVTGRVGEVRFAAGRSVAR